MSEATTESDACAPENHRRQRDDIANNILYFENAKLRQQSQRQTAKELNVPRSSLQHWLKRKDSLDASPVVAAFFEHPDGLAFLHRVVVAAQFVILYPDSVGIRNISLFLKLSKLDAFVGASFGTQQKSAVAMDHAMVTYGREQRAKLGISMAPKKISAVEDETFHPEVCLVAMEPVSNFILLEKYAERRDAGTWTESLREALSDLPVEVIQITSDEAKGLIRHAETELKVHHSPDIFHVLHEIGKGVFPTLSAITQRNKKTHDLAALEVNRRVEDSRNWEGRSHPESVRSPDFSKQIQEAKQKEVEAKQNEKKSQEWYEQVQNAVLGISAAYHPFDLENGSSRNADDVGELLKTRFTEIDQVAQEVGFSERVIQHIEKARRLIPKMVETVAFFWCMLMIILDNYAFSDEVSQVLRSQLVPICYLQQAAKKAKTAEKRHAIQAKADKLLLSLHASDGPLANLNKTEAMKVEQAARECAGLFQRSSSCVEGRNGQLALHHHGQHRLSGRKLEALTVAHNFFTKRQDGTTAAERFFGAKPTDLFGYLVDHLNLPIRPAERRHPKLSEPLLMAS